MNADTPVEPGKGWGPIVVGAKLADVESVAGEAEHGDGNATWPSLGIFVGVAEGTITSVAGCLRDPHDWLFDGKLVPFSGVLDGFRDDASPTDIEAALGSPVRTDDSKPWHVMRYEGIYFTFLEGDLVSWTIGEDADDDDDDDDEDGEEDW